MGLHSTDKAEQLNFDPVKPPSAFEIDRWPGKYHEQLACELAFRYSVMVANQNIFNGLWKCDIARQYIVLYMQRLAKDHQLTFPTEIRECTEIRLANKYTPGGV